MSTALQAPPVPSEHLLASEEAVSEALASAALAPILPLVLRIGHVGHRPHRLGTADPDRLQNLIGRVLQATIASYQRVQEGHPKLFLPEAPRIWGISPLAEGTDRLFVKALLELEFPFGCLEPFLEENYRSDFEPPNAFSPKAYEEFKDLKRQAGRVLTLDSPPAFAPEGASLGWHEEQSARRAEGYALVGRVLVNQSDLLIAVWDGRWQGKTGGTERTIEDALNEGVPVLWIAAQAPHACEWFSQERLSEARKHCSIRPLPIPKAQFEEELNRRINQLLDGPAKDLHARPYEPCPPGHFWTWTWEGFMRSLLLFQPENPLAIRRFAGRYSYTT